ncbi:GH25 family lysozyme [Glaciihabitans sp. UYNi722]|uniref:GH25 family lysozyme n=1 Tax=Glaciihabitans sp. UYNi722 TaxID=3156344 RepID=UPI003391EC58
MNEAQNHTMGSTIPDNEPGFSSPLESKALVAPNSVAPAVPGVPGMDVSGWQTNVDWNAAWANGGRFAYVKATENLNYRSSQFAQQYNGSFAVGMIRGAYHFAIPNVSTGAAQAEFFVANGGGWRQDGRTLPPLLDIEYDPYTAKDGTNTCYGFTPSQMVSWIADFSATVKARSGVLPAIYTTTGWWSLCTGNSPAFPNNPLFIARYPANIQSGPGTLPAGWSTHAFWQFASSGVFPGDQDVSNGSYASLQALATAGVAMAAPIAGGADFNGDGKPDLVARQPDGSLWFYSGTGPQASGATYNAGIKIDTGWAGYNEIVSAGDLDGDGHADILARRPDGQLYLYSGTGHGGAGTAMFGAAVRIGIGWDIFTQIIAPGDVNGDHKADLLARKSDGTLWLYAGTGTSGPSGSGLMPGMLVGPGWNIFTQVAAPGDLDRDGRNDLLGMRSDGSIWFYAGTGSGFSAGVRVNAPGITASDLLIAAGDANGDGYPDMVVRSIGGLLKLLPGSTAPKAAYNPGQVVGSGWNVFRAVIGAGDINGDKKPDLIGVGTDGSLVFYQGNGSAGGVNLSYRPGLRIGSGWQAFTAVIDAGDFDGNGTRDLIGIRNDDTMWFYEGTGVISPSGTGAYKPGVQIGASEWAGMRSLIAGDFTLDGRADVLATRIDGSLSLGGGVRRTVADSPWFAPQVSIASSAWGAQSTLVSAGDANSDGVTDYVARRPDGSLFFYQGTAAMTASSSGSMPGVQTGSGWNVFQTVTATGDDSIGRTGDLIAVTPAGALLYYASTGNAGRLGTAYSASTIAGSGWNIFG